MRKPPQTIVGFTFMLKPALLLLLPLLLLRLLQRPTAVPAILLVRWMPQNNPHERSPLRCRARELGRQISSIRPRLLTYLGICLVGLMDVTWVWLACLHSHKEESDVPTLFRWTFRARSPAHKRKTMVCWAPSYLRNQVKEFLVATVVSRPGSFELQVVKCLRLSVGERVLCLHCLVACFCKLVCCVIHCQTQTSRHPMKGYRGLSCQLGKGGVQALS